MTSTDHDTQTAGRRSAAATAPDFSHLRATFFNCTLKPSPEVSHTGALVEASARLMRDHGVSVDVIRPVDHDIAPACSRI